MNRLFIHQNFPTQYRHIVRHSAGAGDRVIGIGEQHSAEVPGVSLIKYAPTPAISANGWGATLLIIASK
jgi:hypothetical protein